MRSDRGNSGEAFYFWLQRYCRNLPPTPLPLSLFSCAPVPRQSGCGGGGGSFSYWNQQEWNVREGNFSVLRGCSFKRIGQTLIVLFCFVLFSLSVLLLFEPEYESNHKIPQQCGIIRAPSFWPGNQKGWGQRTKKYQEDCMGHGFRKETSQICFWTPGLTLCRWGLDSN